MMDKTYDPKTTEKEIYDLWEKGGYFIPKAEKDKKLFAPTTAPNKQSI